MDTKMPGVWSRAFQIRSRGALAVSLVWLALGLMACSPVTKLVERDLDSAVVMAKAYGNETEVKCFEAMKKGVEQLGKIDKLDSDGIIASTYKSWLLRYYSAQVRQNTLRFCLPIAAEMGANLMIR